MKLALLLAKGGFILLGYAVAVLVSVVVAEGLMLAPTALPDNGRWGSIAASLRELPSMFSIGLFITFIWAFPGFVIALVLAWRNRWRGWLIFSVLGSANAVFSLAIFTGFMGTPFPSMPLGLLASCVPGGFAGGAAYWAAAGRFLGRSVPA